MFYRILFHQSVSESDWPTVHILRQVLNIREGTSVLLFSDGSTLLRSELDSFILSLQLIVSRRLLVAVAVACSLCFSFVLFLVFSFFVPRVRFF